MRKVPVLKLDVAAPVTSSAATPCAPQAGLSATGQLINEARRQGFDNVHDFLVSLQHKLYDHSPLAYNLHFSPGLATLARHQGFLPAVHRSTGESLK